MKFETKYLEQINIIADFLYHHTSNSGFQDCLDKTSLLHSKLYLNV